MRIAAVCRVALVGAMMVVPALASEPVPVPARCNAPDELISVDETLSRTVAALKPGSVLEVLVVGSAPFLSHPPSPPSVPTFVAFPWRMAAAIEAAMPGTKVELTIRGGPGSTAGELGAVIRDEIAAKPYKLVLWQTGTVEAVKNLPPGDFTQALVDGVDVAAEHGADVLLVDPQYSRFLQAHANVEPYETALEQVAAMPGVVLLRRFDLMRHWAEDGQIDLERVPEAQRVPTLELLHSCLGAYLARIVLTGAKS